MIADPRYRACNREEREDWVIRSLRRDGPMDTGEIARAFGVQRPALIRLERHGQIRRTGIVVHRAGRGSARIILWGAP